MAQKRAFAAGQDRRREPPPLLDSRMADGVDGAVYPVEPSYSQAVVDRLPTKTGSRQLPASDHTMLTGGQRGDRMVTWST